jgi:hypothetical protein
MIRLRVIVPWLCFLAMTIGIAQAHAAPTDLPAPKRCSDICLGA